MQLTYKNLADIATLVLGLLLIVATCLSKPKIKTTLPELVGFTDELSTFTAEEIATGLPGLRRHKGVTLRSDGVRINYEVWRFPDVLWERVTVGNPKNPDLTFTLQDRRLTAWQSETSGALPTLTPEEQEGLECFMEALRKRLESA